MSSLIVGVIGYRNHSKNIINLIIKKNVNKIIIYCYKKKLVEKLNKQNKNSRILYTSVLGDLLIAKLIFICSPSTTHIKYIKYFIKKNKYIYCEKPGCTKEQEYLFLKRLTNKEKSKIYFNYNLVKSKLYNKILQKIHVNKGGQPIHCNINISFGLVYKKKFIQNWRFSSKNIFNRITGNLGVHYVNLLNNFFGELKSTKIIEKCTKDKRIIDTSIINLTYKDMTTATIFLSYGAPYSYEIKFFNSNSIFSISETSFDIYSPRDTFNKKGMYITPPKKRLLNNYNVVEDSLKKSVDHFIYIANKSEKFNLTLFNNAINTCRIFWSKNNNGLLVK